MRCEADRFQIQLFQDGIQELGNGAICGHSTVPPKARQFDGRERKSGEVTTGRQCNASEKSSLQQLDHNNRSTVCRISCSTGDVLADLEESESE